MQEEKNYYIVLPITMENIQNAYAFILNECSKFRTAGGGNNVYLIKPNPSNPMFPSYEIEMRESQVNEYRTTLESLKAEFYESSLEYLAAYDLGQGDINPSFI